MAVQPSLGGSQAGGVLAYRLASSSDHSPALFLRVSQAVAQGGDSEGAFGLRFTPHPAVPLSVHAELRATQVGDATLVRPAAFVAGGIDDRPLPLGLAASGYAQAGYVGGQAATAFADGRLAIDRELASFDLGSLRAGGGVWGGAQRGAARLDLGPSAQLRTGIGDVPIRLTIDYRIRVAGEAAPATGAALTLSTGF